MNTYPINTKTSVQLTSLIKREEKLSLQEKMSSRMVKCASVLPEKGQIGWQMYVPRKGLVQMSLFGSADFLKSDLEWIAEHTGKTSGNDASDKNRKSMKSLYEICFSIASPVKDNTSKGFGFSPKYEEEDFSQWPSYYFSQFSELISVLQMTGAWLRIVVGAADKEEQEQCRKYALHTLNTRNVDVKDYIGKPVKIRALIQLPDKPSVRLQTVLEDAVSGICLKYLGEMEEEKVCRIWEHPLEGANVLPDYAARILILEPVLYEPVIGIEITEKEKKSIPASHKNTKSKKAITIGKAIDTSGANRNITIGDMDLRRHYQIIGQTGTGKSTLLSSMILNAVKQGYGLTFFDPHGSTIDMILKCLPEKYADRVRVVRIGDTDNPVPLNIWDSDDPEKEERNISDLCELFSDIFDPKKEGFVGPRYERWLSIFAKASIAFLGKKASLESISILSQSQDNMYKLCKAIVDKYPTLAESIKQEYGMDKSSDFTNLLSWLLCKFQRLTSVEQLRKTLGAGTNALDFSHAIDTDTVTLIDLASPLIGTHASRIVGTLTMMKLWNAAMTRKNRDRTHLVIVDEAALFQTNPMPRMLAESRKFGLSLVLSHQHSGQLTTDVRDALEANSANFSAFRLSPHDAATAAIRLDDPTFNVLLTRLDAFNAVTTLSVDGKQSAPFTLKISLPKKQKDGERIAEYVERRSIETLVYPYKHLQALTADQITYLLNHPEKTETEEEPIWLQEWKKAKNKQTMRAG